MKKLVIAALFVIGAVAVAPSTVKANVLGEQHQSQEASQEAEATCTGSYGQEINCHVKTSQNVKQEQSQKILGASDVINERGGRIHIPVDTAMDTRTLAAVLGITFVGTLAFMAKRRIA